jgi:dimethylargininase
MQAVLREGFSYRFTDAVVRKPGFSVVDGLRAVDKGQPDIKRFQAEHSAYVKVLERAGLKVEVLPSLEAFPDSVFVEDAALCLPGGTIILRPGAPSRAGEAEAIATALSGLGHEMRRLSPGVCVDGGDILVTDTVILVGLSARTNQAGFAALKNILGGWGYSVQAVHTPENVLHFKTDCSLMDSETILATSRLAGVECFAPFRVLTVPPGEEAAANSIRVNNKVLVPAGYPATAELISRAGYAVEVVRADQAALLDGGLSCMSLRFAGSYS